MFVNKYLRYQRPIDWCLVKNCIICSVLTFGFLSTILMVQVRSNTNKQCNQKITCKFRCDTEVESCSLDNSGDNSGCFVRRDFLNYWSPVMRVKTCLFCLRSEFPTTKEIKKSVDNHIEQIWRGKYENIQGSRPRKMIEYLAIIFASVDHAFHNTLFAQYFKPWTTWYESINYGITMDPDSHKVQTKLYKIASWL